MKKLKFLSLGLLGIATVAFVLKMNFAAKPTFVSTFVSVFLPDGWVCQNGPADEYDFKCETPGATPKLMVITGMVEQPTGLVSDEQQLQFAHTAFNQTGPVANNEQTIKVNNRTWIHEVAEESNDRLDRIYTIHRVNKRQYLVAILFTTPMVGQKVQHDMIKTFMNKLELRSVDESELRTAELAK